jgi:hypothetical protein
MNTMWSSNWLTVTFEFIKHGNSIAAGREKNSLPQVWGGIFLLYAKCLSAILQSAL